MEIIDLLMSTVQNSASDLFITAGKPPHCRKFGEVLPLGEEPVSVEQIELFRKDVLLPLAEEEFNNSGGYDAGLTLECGLRFRINFLLQQGLPGFVARPVPFGNDLIVEKLNLPEIISELSESKRGLILIAGTAGSGKSTTMAAMLNYINLRYRKHIVTIEDPIEFVHRDELSLITQREVGADTSSFAEALKNVVRESPDVIVIGEMRDFSTMQTAITAALTGHLVISTVHTSDVVLSLERIINHFPEHLRRQAADDLSMALCGIVAQRLIPCKNEDGMIPAVEVLRATPLVRNLIGTRNFSELDDAIRRGQEDGMITFTRAIAALCKEDLISLEDGEVASSNRDEFLLLMRGMESGIDTFRDDFTSGDASRNKINMRQLLHSAVSNGASDLLLTAGSRPCVRFNGQLTPLDAEILSSADTKRLLFSITSVRQRAIFEESREIDFALTVSMKQKSNGKNNDITARRFRVNGFYQRGNIAISVRVINHDIPTPEALTLPPALIQLVEKKQGLILITGPTGHGKSTSLASLIDRINSNRACHIITVEDPIEYVHENKKAIIEQREVHADTLSFSNALKYVLRQDPDVILVGEMRDPDTISAALTAAETGHLVLATLHTNSAPESVNRIVDSFPGAQQAQVRTQLSSSLLGIVSQRLLERKDGKGRIPAFEVLIATLGVKAMIREGKIVQMYSMIETGAKDGMITMDEALKDLYNRNLINRKDYEGLRSVRRHNQ